MIILASASASRQAMLAAAGVPFTAIPARIDEEAITASLAGERADARRVADTLAELKALKISALHPGRIILGADSVCELDRGTFLDKPVTRARLRAQLARMRGRRHSLVSAAVAVRDGQPLWRHTGVALMDVRAFSEAFADHYAATVPEAVLGSVGGYHLEGEGVQLFAAIRGDAFTVRGLPLLPLLAWLRDVGELPA